MGPLHIEEFRSLIGKSIPRSLEETCGSCGRPYHATVQNMADGNDVCPVCSSCGSAVRKPSAALLTNYRSAFHSLHRFYESFWGWVRGENDEHAVTSCVPDVLFRVDKPVLVREGDDLYFEMSELCALTFLFKAYLLWKTEQTRRAWRRLYYSFWYVEYTYTN